MADYSRDPVIQAALRLIHEAFREIREKHPNVFELVVAQDQELLVAYLEFEGEKGTCTFSQTLEP